MTRTIQLLRGTTVQNDAFTGSAGEVTVDTQTHELRVHDGSTQGGHIIYTKSDVDTALDGKANKATTLAGYNISDAYTKTEIDTALSNKANVATTLSGYGITDGADINLSNITNTGKEVCANMAMPSRSRYSNLTLPASGGSIIAPADGYIHLAKNATAANQRVKLYAASQMAVASWSTGAYNIEVLLPVSKGETVNVAYTADGTTNFFRFIYANGAQ